MNLRTLLPHYAIKTNQPKLTATQLISIHLMKYRGRGTNSHDPLFGPYIDTLPTNFWMHPLTWLVRSHTLREEKGNWVKFLASTPPSAVAELGKLERRFLNDLHAVSDYMVRSWAYCGLLYCGLRH
jgi:hypothetical protein